VVGIGNHIFIVIRNSLLETGALQVSSNKRSTISMYILFPNYIKLNNLGLFKTCIQEKISKLHNAALIPILRAG